MTVVGITGGIGSGKSTIARIFQSLNYHLFNSDSVAKGILESSEIRPALISLFGSGVIKEQAVDRSFIADQVFENPGKLEQLNALIHPRVAEAFEAFKAKHADSLILKEAAILFETGNYKLNDWNILVHAPRELRIQRVFDRDGISREAIEKRIENQWPDEKKIPLADFLIDNSEDSFLIPQVLSVHQEILKKSGYA